MAKISKKQHVALRNISELQAQRKREIILGVGSIILVALVFATYNLLTYHLGILSQADAVPRGFVYICAMVAAGYCGIKFMNASRKRREIEGQRQKANISLETLEAWKRGDIEE